MSDYYDPNEYQGQDDMSFLAELFGSPQYGDEHMGMPGKTFANRLSNLKGIEGLLGIPITQLMGGGSVGGTGEPMPEMGQSYTRQVYGASPQFADGFTAIDSGLDPQSVYQEMVNKRKEYGVNFEPGTPEFEDWSQRTFKVLNDYAFEQAENQGSYDKQMGEWESSGANAGNQFTIGSKKYQGSPDINGMTSEYDLLGAPDLNTLLRSTAEKRRIDNMPSGDRMAEVLAKVPQGRVDMSPQMLNVPQAKRRTGPSPFDLPEAQDGLSMDEFMASQKRGNKTRSQPKSQGNSELDAYQAKYDKVHLNRRLEGSKKNMVRSDANAEAMRKVLAMRALLGA